MMIESKIHLEGIDTKFKLEPVFPERFDIETQKKEIKNYLATNGYVVVKEVADKERIEKAKLEFWDWATHFSKKLKKEDITTWDTEFVGNKYNGICHYINHSEFVWNTRLLPKIKQTFSAIWDTDDLIVSFDAGNAYRPWKYNKKWVTTGGWWHVDQNDTTGKHKKGMVCVQGLVSYYDATEETGGFCLIPQSHRQFEEVCKRASCSKMNEDYIPLDPIEEPLLQSGKGMLLCVQAGDLILWDSRTIHCNTPALVNIEEDKNNQNWDIIRLISYVCMIPFSHASSEVIESRKEGFKLKKPTSHWPNEKITTMVTCHDQPFEIDKCSQEMLELVGFRKSKYNCLII
jgi:ectoine hydroxylase-related dioxygenase (phytanoyl-CoA dioxygenase family)